MELINNFKKTLFENGNLPSKVTVKNYLADINKFVRWYQGNYHKPFPPSALPKELVDSYLNQVNISSPRSAKRYSSSLRKFFSYLLTEGIITYNPLSLPQAAGKIRDPWYLKDFQNFLYSSSASSLTMKNYVTDVRQFLNWTSEVTMPGMAGENQDQVFANIGSAIIEEYKNRLLHEAALSPLSVNRKLSSLRRYIAWAAGRGIIRKDTEVSPSIAIEKSVYDSEASEPPFEGLGSIPESFDALKDFPTPQAGSEPIKPARSRFAPFRLFSKSKTAINFIFDSLVIMSIVKGIEAMKYNLWKATGREVFAPIKTILDSNTTQEMPTPSFSAPPSAVDRFVTMNNRQAAFNAGSFHSVSKSVYAPLKISTGALPFGKRLLYTIRHIRPNWYKKYHTYPVAHYIHFAVALVFATFIGFSIYKAFTDVPEQKIVAVASKAAPSRLISFQGRLQDTANNPISQESIVRFAIYSSQAAPNSTFLWQEVQTVTPDETGSFSTILGRKNKISQDIFVDNPHLFLGISIGSAPELEPRAELANTGLTKNAQELQGLKPITGNNAQTENVILALDSSGNLTIGGSANPIFQATGGEFRLSGQRLVLATNEGSNTNIELNPDGTGIIDVQKPLQNTSNNNNLISALGAVEVNDNFAILATSSAQSALIINQNSTGDLISATTVGSAKFSVNNQGSGSFAGDLSVLGNNLSTVSGTFNIANQNTLYLNIGGAATSISLGSSSGTTTINHALTVSGPIKAKGGIIIPDLPAGSIPFIGASNQLTADNANLFWDSTNKRLGVGTGTPTFKLDVRDSQASGGVAQIANIAAGNTTVGLNLKLGTTTAPQSGNRWINFMDGNGTILGKIRGNNNTNSITFDSNGGDFAEYFIKANPSESIGPGDLVCYSKSQGVEKCSSGSNGILGIYSDNAGFVGAGGHENDPSYVLVGLIGQLKLKISSASKEIQPGDPIAFSADSGLGTKAIKAGQIVGRALEPFDPSSGPKAIRVSLNVSWYDPVAVLMDDGKLAVAFDNTQETTNVDKLDEKLVLSIQNFVNTLEAGVLEIQHISVQSLTVATEDIKIGTKTLRDYITGIVNEILDKRLAEDKNKTIVVVSPLAQVSVDASTSATLEAPEETNETKETSPAASVSSVPSVSSSSSGNITNITNIYNTISSPSAALTPTVQPSPSASPSATPALSPVPYTPTPSPEASPSAAPPTLISENANERKETNETKETITSVSSVPSVSLNTSYANVATFSAELSYVPNLKTDFGNFEQGLIALGPTSLTDTSINGILSVNGSLKISENSIDAIGTNLDLQPLKQGNLSIMGGLVTIDTQGNLTVEGNATFVKDVTVKGKFASNIIAPIPGQDLVLGLDDKEGKAKVEVKNSSGSGVLAVNQLGDIISSGSAQFKNFKIIRGVQADTSFTETVSDGSAGSAVITTNETERTIITPFVLESSLIYITPVTDTKGINPYIARQTIHNPSIGSRGSFTIQIPSAASSDIKFNWVIVN